MAAGALAVLPIALAFLVGVSLTLQLSNLPPESRVAVVSLFDWIKLQSVQIPFEFRVDTLSMTMVLIITGIGSLIHLYAVGYMSEEKDFPRFFTYLNLFIAMMLILVLGNNLVMTFLGWEGVGLCSYLLIGFWYKDLANSKAANKAFSGSGTSSPLSTRCCSWARHRLISWRRTASKPASPAPSRRLPGRRRWTPASRKSHDCTAPPFRFCPGLAPDPA